MSIAVFTLIFMVAASAWNIFCGYSGYIALGHAVFFGIGAYTVALPRSDWHVKRRLGRVRAAARWPGWSPGSFAIPSG